MLSTLSSQHATTRTCQAVRDLERGHEGHHLTDELRDRFVVAKDIPVYLILFRLSLIGLVWEGSTYIFGEEERDHDDYTCYHAQQRREVSSELGPRCIAPADGIADTCRRSDTCAVVSPMLA